MKYLCDMDSTFFKGNEIDLRSISGFLLASRGIWSLGIFLIANWFEIYDYFNHSDSTIDYFKTDTLNQQFVNSNSHLNISNLSNLSAAIKPREGSASFEMRRSSLRNIPTKEEDERVQLNVALQKEIVKFTGLGILNSDILKISQI